MGRALMDLLGAKDAQNSQICWISTQHSHPSILEKTSDLFSRELGAGILVLPLVFLED